MVYKITCEYDFDFNSEKEMSDISIGEYVDENEINDIINDDGFWFGTEVQINAKLLECHSLHETWEVERIVEFSGKEKKGETKEDAEEWVSHCGKATMRYEEEAN